MERLRLGIVIPALNEAKTIGTVVASVDSYGVAIVVDDGSSDGTGAEAEAAGAVVVRHEENRGYDQALNTGFARAATAGCGWVITMDADGQHDPTVLYAFIQALESGADVVVGTRDRRQRLGEHIFSWVAAMKWGIRDPLCGMKGYRIEVYKELGHFDSYDSIGTELALYAAKMRKRILEVQVRTRARADVPRFGRRYSANLRILRALGRGFLHSYPKN